MNKSDNADKTARQTAPAAAATATPAMTTPAITIITPTLPRPCATPSAG